MGFNTLACVKLRCNECGTIVSLGISGQTDINMLQDRSRSLTCPLCGTGFGNSAEDAIEKALVYNRAVRQIKPLAEYIGFEFE